MTKLYMLNGPEIDRSFDLEKDAVYIGRSSDNDIQILDKTVSRRHLKIRRAGNKYFVTDLKSRNGTFFNGKYLSPGIELEVKEGVPIVIGMSLICIGKGCVEQIAPFLDSLELTEEIDEGSGIFIEKRQKTNQKNLELIYKVSDMLMEEDIKEILEKVLDHIFEFLHRADRCVIVIIDPVTKAAREVIYRSKKPDDDINTTYCKDVVDRVLKEEKAVVISDARVEMEDEIADTLKLSKIESVMCLPLMSASKIMGALYIDSLNRPYGFRKGDHSLFNDICRRTAVAMEYAFLTSKL